MRGAVKDVPGAPLCLRGARIFNCCLLPAAPEAPEDRPRLRRSLAGALPRPPPRPHTPPLPQALRGSRGGVLGVETFLSMTVLFRGNLLRRNRRVRRVDEK